MNFWLINIITAFALSVFLTGVLIPQILLISFRRKLFDEVDERKIHKGAIPRLGGLAFTPVLFMSVALAAGMGVLLGHPTAIVALAQDARAITFGFSALLVLYLVGVADDLVGLRYRAKFFAQIIAAILLIMGDVYVGNLHGLLFINELPLWTAYPFTILVVVFLVNAINLIDGIDGLASGLSSIALLCFGVVFFMAEDYLYSTIAFSTFGVLMTFFYYNVFGNAERHKKIFMGDTGSLTIGMILAFLGMSLNTDLGLQHITDANPVIVAFAPLLIPCFDVVRVYFHRLRTHCNPFMPDRNHIHHKLLALGWRQPRAMVTILIASLVLTVANIYASVYININLLLILDGVLCVCMILRLTHCINARNAVEAASR